MRPRGFTPKEFNEGGRKQLTDLMYNHHQAIFKAKTTINNGAPVSLNAPIHKKKKKQINPLKKEEFNEVFEAFRRAEKAKTKGATVDTRQPDTLKLKTMLSAKTRKSESFQQQEHERNLRIQKDHIRNTGKSMMERKKNKFDPVAHPSYFLRNKGESRAPITVEYLAKKLLETNLKFQEAVDLEGREEPVVQENRGDANELYESVKMDVKKYRKLNSAIPPSKKKDVNPRNLALSRLNSAGSKITEGGLVPVPQVEGKEEEDYDKLKSKLVHAIIEYRVYKTEDLNSLFGRTLLYNKHLDSVKLQDMFDFIKDEFES